jgi:hypothetical protein
MKTIFILGAGASKDFGYPDGPDLKGQIVSELKAAAQSGSSPLFDVLLQVGNAREDILEFGRRLHRSLRDTIDEFVEAHQANDALRRIGKQAVAYCIARCERDEALFNSPGPHWYKILADFFQHNPGKIGSAHFSFFTFNYDRSLEHCLREALLSGNAASSEGVEQDLLSRQNLCHVHGNVGPLPWQPPADHADRREYGQPVTAASLTQIAYDILLPYESFRVHAVHQEMLTSADVIAIIGLGFHEQNLGRIGFDQLTRTPGKQIFATTFNLQDEAKLRMLAQRPSVRTLPLNAEEFVRQFLSNMLAGTLSTWGTPNTILEPTRLANLQRLVDGLTRPTG